MVETFKLKCNKILIVFFFNSYNFILWLSITHIHIESSNEKKTYSFVTTLNIEENQKKNFFCSKLRFYLEVINMKHYNWHVFMIHLSI